MYDGEIGSSNAYAVGGLVGGYDGGQIKVGRFSATTVRPTSTNNYEACFIGTRVNGAGFTYGAFRDIAYLFADTATKANQGIWGSRVEMLKEKGYNVTTMLIITGNNGRSISFKENGAVKKGEAVSV